MPQVFCVLILASCVFMKVSELKRVGHKHIGYVICARGMLAVHILPVVGAPPAKEAKGGSSPPPPPTSTRRKGGRRQAPEPADSAGSLVGHGAPGAPWSGETECRAPDPPHCVAGPPPLPPRVYRRVRPGHPEGPECRGVLSFAFLPFSSTCPASPFHTREDLGGMRDVPSAGDEAPDRTAKTAAEGRHFSGDHNGGQCRGRGSREFAGGSGGGNGRKSGGCWRRVLAAVTRPRPCAGLSGRGVSWRSWPWRWGRRSLGRARRPAEGSDCSPGNHHLGMQLAYLGGFPFLMDGAMWVILPLS